MSCEIVGTVTALPKSCLPLTEPSRAAPEILVLPREDGHALAQALSKLGKGKGGLPVGEFEDAASSTRVARELIVVSIGSRVGCQTLRSRLRLSC